MKILTFIFLSMGLCSSFSKDYKNYFVNKAIYQYCLSEVEREYCTSKVKNSRDIHVCYSKFHNSQARIEYNLKQNTGHLDHNLYKWIQEKISKANGRQISNNTHRCEKLKDKRKMSNCLELVTDEFLEEVNSACLSQIKDKKKRRRFLLFKNEE